MNTDELQDFMIKFLKPMLIEIVKTTAKVDAIFHDYAEHIATAENTSRDHVINRLLSRSRNHEQQILERIESRLQFPPGSFSD